MLGHESEASVRDTRGYSSSTSSSSTCSTRVVVKFSIKSIYSNIYILNLVLNLVVRKNRKKFRARYSRILLYRYHIDRDQCIRTVVLEYYLLLHVRTGTSTAVLVCSMYTHG